MSIDVNSLRKILKDSNLTQADLAQAAGYMSPTYLNVLMSGRLRPTAETEKRIRRGLEQLGISKSEILKTFCNKKSGDQP